MILRREQRNRFTVIDNSLLEDVRLSWKARGLAAFLMSKPDGWSIRVNHLIEQAPDGETSVTSGLRELTDHGYMKRVRVRGAGGRLKLETWLADYPAYENDGTPQDRAHGICEGEAANQNPENPGPGKAETRKTRDPENPGPGETGTRRNRDPENRGAIVKTEVVKTEVVKTEGARTEGAGAPTDPPPPLPSASLETDLAETPDDEDDDPDQYVYDEQGNKIRKGTYQYLVWLYDTYLPGIPVGPMQAQGLHEMEAYPLWQVEAAWEMAYKRSKRRVPYVLGILRDWSVNGYDGPDEFRPFVDIFEPVAAYG